MIARKTIRVLAIETSCDETAVALVHVSPTKNVRVVQNLISSQIPIHQKYGGVVPEVAARTHVAETVSLITQALGKKGTSLFDLIAVTRGPGLPTALGVGLEAAKTLAFVSKKPIIGVNHLEGHLASAWLSADNRKRWQFPLLALSASGGHTELILMRDFCKYRVVGRTRDDAAGEAFDKSAKLMGLPYPGGPQIAKLGEGGNMNAFDLPRPMMKDPSFDMSFSGLKTAVRIEWEKLKVQKKDKRTTSDFAASLQQAIVDVLVSKTLRAAKQHKVKGVVLVGGVSANKVLRQELETRVTNELRIPFLPSDRSYITDNAAMIAAAGYWRWKKGERHNWRKLDVKPEWDLG